MSIDATDKKLLRLLQEDSKRTHKFYSTQLGLSTTAVYERIKKLERSGVVSRYTAVLNKEKVHKSFVAFCHVKLLQHSKEFVLQFEKDIAALEEVVSCFHLAGDYDYLLKIQLEDMAAYRHFLVSKLTAIPHIGSTQSAFVISEVKDSTHIPL